LRKPVALNGSINCVPLHSLSDWTIRSNKTCLPQRTWCAKTPRLLRKQFDPDIAGKL
jgi:hypothetical protein